jgi:hypothetical protein
MRVYSAPSLVYSIFLKRNIPSLHVRALGVGASCYINSIDRFLALYMILGEEDKNILRDLYRFYMVMIINAEYDPNPYVGDIWIKDLTSFMHNQIQWIQSMSFVDKI